MVTRLARADLAGEDLSAPLRPCPPAHVQFVTDAVSSHVLAPHPPSAEGATHPAQSLAPLDCPGDVGVATPVSHQPGPPSLAARPTSPTSVASTSVSSASLVPTVPVASLDASTVFR